MKTAEEKNENSPIEDNENDQTEQRLATGMCIGLAIGAGIGSLFDNMATGIGLGMALGVCVGAIATGEKSERNSLRMPALPFLYLLGSEEAAGRRGRL